MRWLAVIATSTYIFMSGPWGALSAAETAPLQDAAAAQEAPAGGGVAFKYDSEDRRDPFNVLVRETPDPSTLKPVIDPNRQTEVLERFDLSALTLRGIVWGELGRRGVIRAPDEKGYFVSVGNYIGEKGGRVIDITADRLVIEEKYKDTEGNIVAKTLDLPLRREDN